MHYMNYVELQMIIFRIIHILYCNVFSFKLYTYYVLLEDMSDGGQ